MPHLEIRTGRNAGKTYDLTKNMILGRGDTADIQLPDGKASREHARVFKQAGKWAVADLNSRNGIKVNGLKATRKDLFDGDQFEVGETLVAFVGEGGAARVAAVADDVDELDLGGDEELDVGGDAEVGHTPMRRAEPVRQATPRPAAPPPAARKPAAKAPSGGKQSAKEAAFAAARAAAAGKTRGSGGKSQPVATDGIMVSDNVLQFNKVDANKSSFLSIDLSQYGAFTQFLIWCGVVAFLGGFVWFLFKMLADAAA